MYTTRLVSNVNTGESTIKGYHEALPANYDKTKKYPLLISFAGTGEIGQGTDSSLKSVTNVSVAKRIENKTLPDYGMIIISPQVTVAFLRSGHFPLAFIDYLIVNYSVDENRIYMIGLSDGGGHCEYFAGLTQWVSGDTFKPILPKLAAMIPMCGNITPSQPPATVMKVSNVPIWFVHNSGDNVVGVDTSKFWYALINSTLCHLTVFNASGHDCWTAATDPNYKGFEGKNMYEWLLTNSKTGVVVPPVIDQPPLPPVPTDTVWDVQITNGTADASGMIVISFDGSKTTFPSGYTVKNIWSWHWLRKSGQTGYYGVDSTSMSKAKFLMKKGTYTFTVSVDLVSSDKSEITVSKDITFEVK